MDIGKNGQSVSCAPLHRLINTIPAASLLNKRQVFWAEREPAHLEAEDPEDLIPAGTVIVTYWHLARHSQRSGGVNAEQLVRLQGSIRALTGDGR